MARFPQKIHRLILTSPGPIFPVRAELTKLPAPDSFLLKRPIFTNAEGNKKASNIRSKVMNFFAFSFGWRLASETEADRFAAYGGYYVDRSTVCDTANIPGMEEGSGFYAGVRTFKSLLEIKDYRSTLKRLKTPVLVLKGQCDNQPWGYTKEYIDVFENHQLQIIPAAGHFLWVEQQTLSQVLIKRFLNDSTLTTP